MLGEERPSEGNTQRSVHFTGAERLRQSARGDGFIDLADSQTPVSFGWDTSSFLDKPLAIRDSVWKLLQIMSRPIQMLSSGYS